VILHRTLARQLLPGLVLPGLIYLVVSRRASVLVALAAASAVPLLDAGARAVRRRPQSPFGLLFILLTGVSVGLAFWLHSPRLILAKGAVVTAAAGLAFAASAVFRRPLTRTLATMLSAPNGDVRARLAERWRHPVTHRVFCTLSAGWGVLLLASAAQQGVLAFTASPGLVMAVEPAIHLVVTGGGILASILYVRGRQRRTPEIGLLPLRVV
jgi:hypothetical protein